MLSRVLLILPFNPRSRTGSDLGLRYQVHMELIISIHAPAWGATGLADILIDGHVFQSTLPHGERL